jgi:hypothetical protein
MIMEVLERRMIESVYDLTDLGIIDWHRLNGYWRNEADAIEAVASWFIGKAEYLILRCDLTKYPLLDQAQFEWKHVGEGHRRLGYLYWNYFQQRKIGTIAFGDQPDFWGEFVFRDGHKARFWGDIGKVSASSFARAQKAMREGDAWISVLDEFSQVMIEAHEDLAELYHSLIRGE